MALSTEAEPNARPGSTAEDNSFLRNLRLWVSSFSAYAQDRLELAGLEGREAFTHYLKVIIFAALALFGVLFGYVFLMVGLVLLIAYFTGWSLVWPALIVALLHFMAAAGSGLAIRGLLKVPQFQQTLAEFKKDKEWTAR